MPTPLNSHKGSNCAVFATSKTRSSTRLHQPHQPSNRECAKVPQQNHTAACTTTPRSSTPRHTLTVSGGLAHCTQYMLPSLPTAKPTPDRLFVSMPSYGLSMAHMHPSLMMWHWPMTHGNTTGGPAPAWPRSASDGAAALRRLTGPRKDFCARVKDCGQMVHILPPTIGLTCLLPLQSSPSGPTV